MWPSDRAAGADGGVKAQAEARLRESPELADCPITCEFRDGTLTLRGRVTRYSLKQTARLLVQRIQDVEAVEDQIDVIPLPISERPNPTRRPVSGDNPRRTE
jgi:osmotically-inducible protein OsmY